VMVLAILVLFYGMTSLAVFCLPHMTHRAILFGVVVSEAFRSSPEGRKAIRTYRIAVGISSLAGLLLLLLLRGRWLAVGLTAGPLANAAVSIVMFVRLNHRLKRFGVPLSPIRQIDLVTPQERITNFVWLGVIPLVLLLAVAFYLRAHWQNIPASFPVHWDINGQPNRWIDRSVRGVFGPLVFGGEMTLWLFAFALAAWYGTRQSEPIRKPMVVLLIAVECIMGAIFFWVALLPLRAGGRAGIAGLVMGLLALPLTIAVVVYMIKKSIDSGGPVDPTPAECWKGGMIYYNPNDAALFVGRRDSLGLTVNLANPWSWVMAGSLPILVALGFLMLH
jgi:uncharacterized membrane protein